MNHLLKIISICLCMVLRNYLVLTVMLAGGLTCASQTTATVKVQGSIGKPVSPDLVGIFFEDINYAADGGLYAELVQNRSFEYSRVDNRDWNCLSYWALLSGREGQATVTTEITEPLNANNPHYAVLTVREKGDRNGLSNEGFDGIVVRKGDTYDVSLFARIFEGNPETITVRIENPSGMILGQTKLTDLQKEWTQHTAVITANADHTHARLVVLVNGTGKLGLDMISLFPQKTFKHRKNGLRADLAQVIADLKPKFIRFPGGCLAHGDGLENMYRWKDTIGPVQQRKAQRNIWRYHQTMGLGYFEYFQFCEDIGAKPLPVVPAGVCCQNSGNYLNLAPKGQRGLPMDQMDDYVQEVLDLIEWANGPADSEWGSKRAQAGHPEPFNLRYLGLGNEDVISDVFKVRYKMINDAVKSKYPEIVVIGTTGPFTDGRDYDEGWKFAKEQNLPMVDEHGYKSPNWFWENLQRFDAYERTGTKVYLGEYAAHEQNRANTLRSGLAEAAYMTTLERNGDLVYLSSYAPLLSKQGRTQWRPDLIYFDNMTVTPSINYYVQQLFSTNQGDVYFPTTFEIAEEPKDESVSNGVMVGTWNTQAVFDNVKVLAGTTIVLNESFSGPVDGWNKLSGNWQAVDGVYRQQSADTPALSMVSFADDQSGYTVSLKAMKKSGDEGFLIGFGAIDAQNYYWLNLGGWGNTTHRVEKATDGSVTPIGPSVAGEIVSNRWYDIRIQVNGPHIQCYLDGSKIIDMTDRGFTKTPDIAASTVRDIQTGDVIVKLVSKAEEETKVSIDLRALGSFEPKAVYTTLSGPALAENRFGQPPQVLPQVSEISVSKAFQYIVPPHSLSVIRMKAK